MIINDCGDLRDSIISLKDLLDHKVKRTQSENPLMRNLNDAIQTKVQHISTLDYFADIGDDEFKAAYRNLSEIVGAFDPEINFSKEKRDDLVLVMVKLFQDEDWRGMWGPDWHPPKLECESHENEAEEAHKDPLAKKVWWRRSCDVHD